MGLVRPNDVAFVVIEEQFLLRETGDQADRPRIAWNSRGKGEEER